jgi:L-ascorbate metabolism protein UlaG (beta-lactamase superfamily)
MGEGTTAMAITLTFHGHSCFQLDDGEHSLLVDPFFTDNPAAKIAASDIKCTHIAITHGHFDHFADCEGIAKANEATVCAAFEICEYLSEQGHEKCEPGNTGGRIETPFGGISFTPAIHSSSFEGRYMGMPCGLMIEFAGAVLYHAGDTALFSDMEFLGQMYQPDIAMFPIGDRFTMGPEMAAVAAEMVGAQTAIPMHYNTWPPIEVAVERFAPKDIDVLIMEPGEALELAAE